MQIRPESPEDLPGIRHVNSRAFGRKEEARLVDDLRDGGYSRLSLVAATGGRIVGHIMLSEATIRSVEAETPALALGPVGVIPEHRGRGVGSALVREGLDRCARSGHRIVVLLGHPDYYARFGFSADLAANLASQYSGEYFMALELAPDALDGIEGDFEFAPPFRAVS